MEKYSVSIKWSEEDGGFIALAPELPGLSTFGPTPSSALKEFAAAEDSFLEAWKRTGKPLPQPETLLPFSGQLRLRMPRSLHRDLAARAENEGVSLNTLIVTLLASRSEREDSAKSAARSSDDGPGRKYSVVTRSPGSLSEAVSPFNKKRGR
jgi:predicted HicB family RNase H-like nuclease